MQFCRPRTEQASYRASESSSGGERRGDTRVEKNIRTAPGSDREERGETSGWLAERGMCRGRWPTGRQPGRLPCLCQPSRRVSTFFRECCLLSSQQSGAGASYSRLRFASVALSARPGHTHQFHVVRAKSVGGFDEETSKSSVVVVHFPHRRSRPARGLAVGCV